MRKFLSITAMLLIATMCFSQKANVKKAYSKSEAMEKPDFDGAIDLIEQALKDETTKNDAYTWWVAGHIYDRIIAYEYEKQVLGSGSTDKERVNESAYTAYDYFIKAYELDQIPNEKGQVKPKYTKKIGETLKWYFNTGLIANFGASLVQAEDYAVGLKAFEKHLSIPDLPFLIGTKDSPIPRKENNDSLFWNIKFYDALYTQFMADATKDEAKKEEITKTAIKKYEAIKDKGYREDAIYQQLYNLYDLRNDTANMIRILDEGIVRLPKEVFYLGMKINILIEQGKEQEAIRYLQTAVERNPENGKYHNIMGNLYSIIGKRVDAMKSYDIAIKLEPNNADFVASKGVAIYSEAKEMETASLTTRDPKTAEMLKATANAKFQEAKNTFLEALELDEKNYIALANLKEFYFKFNDMKKYDEILKRLQSPKN